jgi:hypothetical protein
VEQKKDDIGALQLEKHTNGMIKEKSIEPEDFSVDMPEFFMHRYGGGKRGYNSFRCTKCMAVVRVDRMPIARVWKCKHCANRHNADEKDADPIPRDK